MEVVHCAYTKLQTIDFKNIHASFEGQRRYKVFLWENATKHNNVLGKLPQDFPQGKERNADNGFLCISGWDDELTDLYLKYINK